MTQSNLNWMKVQRWNLSFRYKWLHLNFSLMVLPKCHSQSNWLCILALQKQSSGLLSRSSTMSQSRNFEWYNNQYWKYSTHLMGIRKPIGQPGMVTTHSKHFLSPGPQQWIQDCCLNRVDTFGMTHSNKSFSCIESRTHGSHRSTKKCFAL